MGGKRKSPEAMQRNREYLRRWNARKWAENSPKLAALKLQRGCADCGYRGHPAALEFDHLPGMVKVGAVSQMTRASWETIQIEIAKCEVVCANCHAIRTVTRRQDKEKRLSTAS